VFLCVRVRNGLGPVYLDPNMFGEFVKHWSCIGMLWSGLEHAFCQ
jgi:hypothetical protein